MEVVVRKAPFGVDKDCLSCFGWNFMKKKRNFEIFSQNVSQKNLIKTAINTFLSLTLKSTVQLLIIFTYFRRIDKISGKNSGKCE